MPFTADAGEAPLELYFNTPDVDSEQPRTFVVEEIASAFVSLNPRSAAAASQSSRDVIEQKLAVSLHVCTAPPEKSQ